MNAIELVNQFLIYTILWLTLVPIIYIFTINKQASILNNIGLTIGSIALSFFLIMFAYTLMANIGLITALASICKTLANAVIVLLILLSPILVLVGHYKLEHYRTEK